MKEAAGEANMTIVTIVLIAIVLGAGTLIVTNIMKGMGSNTSTICAQMGGAKRSGGGCYCPDGTALPGGWSKSDSNGYSLQNGCSGSKVKIR